jgi:hypothetical protein
MNAGLPTISHDLRNDIHNVSIDVALARVGRCAMTHLASGRVCAKAARHQGSCEFVPREQAYASLGRTSADHLGRGASACREVN